MKPKPKFLVGVVLDNGVVVDALWYRHEDRELKEIGAKDCVLLRN
jgi:hypothetical protein